MKKKIVLLMLTALMVFAAVPALAAVPKTSEKTGLVTIDGAQYYYGKDKKLVKNKKVFKIKKKYYNIDKTGFVTQWTGAFAKACKRLDSLKAIPKNTKSKTRQACLKKAFKWSATKLRFSNSAKPSKVKDPIGDYAKYGFSKKRGDCNVQAATFCAMATVLGYDAHLVQGYVPQALKDGKPSKFGEHAWVTIKMGKKTYVFDPNFEKTHKAGWKFKYGAKGHYRYFDSNKNEIGK